MVSKIRLFCQAELDGDWVAVHAEHNLKMGDKMTDMDNFNMEGMTPEDQKRMTQMLEMAQVRDGLRMYNFLVEKCFTQCVDGFRKKSLDKTEETCVKRCAEKFLKHTARVSMRFTELQREATGN